MHLFNHLHFVITALGEPPYCSSVGKFWSIPEVMVLSLGSLKHKSFVVSERTLTEKGIDYIALLNVLVLLNEFVSSS